MTVSARLTLLTILAALLLPMPLDAAVTFERTYGGAWTDVAHSAQVTSDHGFIVAGSTRSFGARGEDIYLFRTDSFGNTLWTKTYGGAYDDYGAAAFETFDGGYFTAGGTQRQNGGAYDITLLKTDSRGDTQWTRTFGGASEDLASSAEQTSDSGFVVAGWTQSFGSGADDIYLIKTDINGDTEWTRTYGGADADLANSVRQTTDGGYIIAGYTYSFGAGDADVYLVKTDAEGNTLWTRTFGGPGRDGGNSVTQTTGGGFAVTGYAASFGDSAGDVYLVVTDANGDTLWTKTYGGPQGEIGNSVQQTRDSGFIIVGSTYSFGLGGTDVCLIKTDAGGDTLWTRTFGGDSNDYAYSLRQTADGGYIIGGTTYSFGAGKNDAWLIKTDSLGNVAVVEPKTTPTRKPSLSLSCEPNPFRTHTAISLQLTADSPAEMTVFDASGRRVRTLPVSSEPHTVWDGTDDGDELLPTGAYFVRVDTNGQHASTRVVLQR